VLQHRPGRPLGRRRGGQDGLVSDGATRRMRRAVLVAACYSAPGTGTCDAVGCASLSPRPSPPDLRTHLRTHNAQRTHAHKTRTCAGCCARRLSRSS
jgi:hypothetical protein